jgi:signal transduction histidine kinase
MSLKRTWNDWIGHPSEFSMENRVLNAIGMITFFTLVGMTIINTSLKLWVPAITTFAIAILQAVVYFITRYRKKVGFGTVAYASISYATLSLNYFYNSGLDGPTLILFFLTFLMLITVAETKWHWLFIVLHILIPGTLISTEYFYPESIKGSYLVADHRYIDIGLSYILTIIFVYFVGMFLRRYYEREKQIADLRNKSIQLQNTEIRNQRNELMKSNEDKVQLFSIISHDLRTPLSQIHGFLELLRYGELSEDERKDLTNELYNSTTNTLAMINNLLNWSKSKLEGMTPSAESISIEGLLSEVIESLKQLTSKKGLEVEVRSEKDYKIFADIGMMEIVVRNILHNAIKFSPVNGLISIHVTEHDDEVEMAIQDSGKGIPEEKRNSIFKQNLQSGEGTLNEKGTGIGLHLCKELVEKQNGSIWFESANGVGTKFHLRIPKLLATPQSAIDSLEI